MGASGQGHGVGGPALPPPPALAHNLAFQPAHLRTLRFVLPPTPELTSCITDLDTDFPGRVLPSLCAASMPVLTLLLLLLLSGAALPPAAEACTSIIVGKKASSDGSVFIARNGAHCRFGVAGSA